MNFKSELTHICMIFLTGVHKFIHVKCLVRDKKPEVKSPGPKASHLQSEDKNDMHISLEQIENFCLRKDFPFFAGESKTKKVAKFFFLRKNVSCASTFHSTPPLCKPKCYLP